jgi:PEP-CTERM motif
MRATLSKGVAATVAFGMSFATAGAQTLYLGYTKGGPPTTIASSTTGVVAGPGPDFIAVGADILGLKFDSTALSLTFFNSGPVTEAIVLSETDLSFGTPEKVQFISNFTENALKAGFSVTESTYFNADNMKYGTENLLATATFTSATPSGAGPFTMPETITALYSLTQVYTIVAPFGDQFQSTIDLTTNPLGPATFAPEPSTWAMMMIGFAGLGYAAVRRGRRVAVASEIA